MSEFSDLIEECLQLYDSFGALLVENQTLSLDGDPDRHQRFRRRLAAHHEALRQHHARLVSYGAVARFRRECVLPRHNRTPAHLEFGVGWPPPARATIRPFPGWAIRGHVTMAGRPEG